MSQQYYIMEDGRLSDTFIFGTSYIFVECGSPLVFDPLKLKRLLSNNVSYSINLIDDLISEIHFGDFISPMPTSIPTKNTPSSLTLEELLAYIK